MTDQSTVSRNVLWSSVHLDAVRGSAAVLVMLGHSRDLFFSSLTEDPIHAGVQALSGSPGKVLPPHITVGDEMVVVFFVLSGYLVGGSVLRDLAARRWSWQDYLLKRLTRLWVVLIPALSLGLVLDWAGLHWLGGVHSIYSGPQSQNIVSSTLANGISLRTFLGNVLFVQGIYVRLAGTNDSLWSLAYEFWYYVCFPALLLPFASWLSRTQRAIAVLVSGSIAIFIGPTLASLFPIWVAGAVLAKVRWRLPRRSVTLVCWILSVTFPLGCVQLRRISMIRWQARYLIGSYFLLLLWALLQQQGSSRVGLYRTIAGELARFSYTLYLVHLPVIVLLTALVNPIWHKLPRSPSNVLLYLMVNVVAVAIACLFYLVFERNTDRVREGLRSILVTRGKNLTKLQAVTHSAC